MSSEDTAIAAPPASGAAAAHAVQVLVLGPLQLVVDGDVVQVPGRKRRAVLAVLTMAAPGAVATDRLVDAIWPDNPPASGRAALQSHIARLRAHLGRHRDRLTYSDAGYRLALEPDRVDAERLAARLHRARAVAQHDPAAAVAELVPTQQDWRGEPLAELQDVPPLSAWSRSLIETYCEAADLLAECARRTGDAALSLTVAAATAAIEPLRERTACAIMRALAEQGRAAEALRVAHDFRAHLVETTGLDASPALAQLEHDIAGGTAEPGRGNPADLPGGARVAAFAAHAPPPGLPPLAPLIGRTAEVNGVLRLLEAEPLVTLVGPGGVGKTHLAIEVARRAPGTVTMVSLAAVTDGRAVPDALAHALRLGAAPGDVVDRCIQCLRAEPDRLLLLDNCEHVLTAVRPIVLRLLAACPTLRILATSRERLGVQVERTCRLDPLPMPDPASTEDLRSVPSVAMFLDRARRVGAPLDADDDLGAVARVVRALDGIPLAIELAAGRLTSMTVTDLETRLDRTLDLIGDTRHAESGIDWLPHRTLRAAIGWSYELLPPDGQRLFRHLAVFPDGFDLATAERLGAAIGVESDPTTVVARLVDASMVTMSTQARPRYHMLDTLRRFGLDQLAVLGETSGATRHLQRWAVDLAAWFDAVADTEEERHADARVRAEVANLRAAATAAHTAGDLDQSCAIVLGLHLAVVWRDDLGELWRWVLELTDDPALEGHPSEAALLGLAAEVLWCTAGDLDRAERTARRAVSLAPREDDAGWTMSRFALGDVLVFRGRYDDAATLFLESRRGTRWEAEGCAQAALARAYQGDLRAARRLVAEARARPRSPTMRGYLRYVEGEIAGRERDWPAAEQAYRDAILTAHDTGASFLAGIAAVGLASTLASAGRTTDALVGYQGLIDRWERSGGWTQLWTTLRNLADVLDVVGDRASAGALRAAADAAPESSALDAAGRAVPSTASADPADREGVLALARSAIARALDRHGSGARR